MYLQLVYIVGEANDLESLRHQFLNDRFPDPGASAGDKSDFIRQNIHIEDFVLAQKRRSERKLLLTATRKLCMPICILDTSLYRAESLDFD